MVQSLPQVQRGREHPLPQAGHPQCPPPLFAQLRPYLLQVNSVEMHPGGPGVLSRPWEGSSLGMNHPPELTTHTCQSQEGFGAEIPRSSTWGRPPSSALQGTSCRQRRARWIRPRPAREQGGGGRRFAWTKGVRGMAQPRGGGDDLGQRIPDAAPRSRRSLLEMRSNSNVHRSTLVFTTGC